MLDLEAIEDGPREALCLLTEKQPRGVQDIARDGIGAIDALTAEVRTLRAQVAELRPWAREAAECVGDAVVDVPDWLVADVKRPAFIGGSPEARAAMARYYARIESLSVERADALRDRIDAGEFGEVTGDAD